MAEETKTDETEKKEKNVVKTKKKEAKPKAKPEASPKAVKPAAKKPAVIKSVDSVKANKALILSFRRGRHTQRTNQFLIEIEGADTRAKASLFIGKRVVWTSPGKIKKQIFGKISSTHGNNGVLRARFSRGLPGTALTTYADILE